MDTTDLTNAINQLTAVLNSFSAEDASQGFLAVMLFWVSGFGFGLMHSMIKKMGRWR